MAKSCTNQCIHAIERTVVDKNRLRNTLLSMDKKSRQVTTSDLHLLQELRDDFNEYVELQRSGKTNMFDIGNVMTYTGLSREQIVEIMHNYSELKRQYLTD